MRRDPDTIRRLQQGMHELGVTPERINHIKAAPSFDEANRRLEKLKADAKREWKRKALELHPDRTGGDPGKTERFKMLLSAAEQVGKLHIQRPRPRPRVNIINFTNARPASTTNSTNSSANTTFVWGARQR